GGLENLGAESADCLSARRLGRRLGVRLLAGERRLALGIGRFRGELRLDLRAGSTAGVAADLSAAGIRGERLAPGPKGYFGSTCWQVTSSLTIVERGEP